MTTVLDSLNDGLQRCLQENPTVILMGEDIIDPYGGAFKVTRGLSTRFPDRVWTTPISEAGIVGAAVGMAVRGLRPVVEIMFGDFLTLATDQLINHAAKLHLMYAEPIPVPLVVRTPMGGRRGYGPTHSQTLEKLFMGTPGIMVVAPFNLDGQGGPGELLGTIVATTDQPVLFIENKLQYLLPVFTQEELPDLVIEPGKHVLDPVRMCVRGAPPARITLTAYGYMAELARQAMLRLAYEDEVFTELVVFKRLAPFQLDILKGSVQRTGRLLSIEEGTLSMGWGAEILARVAEEGSGKTQKMKRLAARECPVPASMKLEEECLPGVEAIIKAVREMVSEI